MVVSLPIQNNFESRIRDLPRSSSGLGRDILNVEIMGSIPIRGTKGKSGLAVLDTWFSSPDSLSRGFRMKTFIGTGDHRFESGRGC